MDGWEAIIGLECHVQLDTRTKLFCACPQPSSTDAPHNTLICSFCAGLGGAPTPSGEAIGLALRAALALGCEIRAESRFERKAYSNPDLPKGYQITQQRRPIAGGGRLRFDGGQLALRGLHLEEDAGRRAGETLDLNRAGAALIEVVSEPDLRDPEAASEAARMLRRVLMSAGVTRGEMAEGHLRFDANVSVRRVGEAPGQWVELKNLNSFRAIRRSARAEIARQIALIEGGGAVEPETRAWDGKATRRTRRRLAGADYDFQPEPNLPAVRPDAAALAAAGVDLNAPLDAWLLARDRAARARWRADYGLDDETIAVIGGDPEAAAFFQAAVAAGGPPGDTAAWLRGEVTRGLAEASGRLADCALTPDALAGLVAMVSAGRLPRAAGRRVLAALMARGGDPEVLAAGMAPVADEAALLEIVAAAVAGHPEAAARYRAGRTNVLGFFVGVVLKETRGRADPGVTRRLLENALG